MASHVQPLNAVTPNLQDPTVLAQMQQWGFTNQSPAWWESYFNTVNQQSLQQPSIASINTNNLPESFNNLQTAALGALAQNIQQSMGSWMQTMGSRVQAGWQQFNVPLNNFANNTLLAPSTTAPTPYQLSAAVADIDITTLPTVDGKTPAVASADYTQLANTTLEPEANTNTPRQLAGTDPLTIGMNSPAGGYPALAGVSPYGFTVPPTTATVGEDSGIAALLAGAYPPPGSVGGSTGLTPTAMPISNPLIYAPTASAYTGGAYTPPQFADSSSTLQQMMNQNLALTSEGTALNLYLQQVQQVAQAQQRPTGPIYAAPQFTQSTPTIMSAAPISSAVGNNGSSSGTSSGTLPMQSTSSDKRSKKYEQVLQGLKLNLSTKQQASLKQFQQVFEQNKSKYEAVAKRLGVPQELVPLAAKAIWALHCREGSCDLSTYLHNGEKLGKRTTLVPAGVLFDNWEDAAVDAIKRELPKVSGGLPKSVPEWLAFAEVFNGTGYEQKGTASPYVLAGTNAYKKGKYVADGKYDPNHVDQQLGVAALITA